MSGQGTAGQQLERILYLLPLASREGGVPLVEAARHLGVDVETVQRDLEEVTARAFYHLAGGADEMQILVEADVVKIYTHRKFDRPTRLSFRETLALAIGLRAAATEAAGGGASLPLAPDRVAAIRDLACRMEMELAVSRTGGEDEQFEIDEGDDRGTGLRARLKEAARSRERVRIRYLKDGATETEEREVDPYAVVYASGKWYVIGHCHLRVGVRAFRVDRVLDVSPMAASFEIPAEFDSSDYVSDGRVFRSDAEEQVVVRYSARVAPWVREQGPIDELTGGAVSVSFTAADPDWIVRHVLSFGTEARVVSPQEVREMVVGALAALLGPG